MVTPSHLKKNLSNLVSFKVTTKEGSTFTKKNPNNIQKWELKKQISISTLIRKSKLMPMSKLILRNRLICCPRLRNSHWKPGNSALQ